MTGPEKTRPDGCPDLPFTEEDTVELDPESGIRDILDALPFFVLLLDSDHRIILANQALSQAGLSPRDLEGKYCPQVIHGQHSPYHGCPLEEVVRTNSGLEREIHLRETDSWIQSSVYPTRYRTTDGRQVFLHMSRDITEAKKMALDLERRYLEQSALADLLTISLSQDTLGQQLQAILIRLLSLPWLAIKGGKGAVFITGEDGMLHLMASRGLHPILLECCASIPFGHCMCGKAARDKTTIFSSEIDDRHDVHYEGMESHGHYCVPIMSGDQVLGVLNTYVAHGHVRRAEDEAFLDSAMGVLAGLIQRRTAEESLERALMRLKTNLDGTAQAIATAMEVRDPYTAGHQLRVTSLACALAKELGLDKERIEVLRTAAQLHDIGKIQIPSEILSKPGKLSRIEFAIIQNHSLVGFEILKNIDFSGPVAEIVYQHHEKLNGKGYPRGLSGENILLEARILTVADVVEAVASHRPYRAAMGVDKALEILAQGRNEEFDPQVVDACLRLFQEGRFQF